MLEFNLKPCLLLVAEVARRGGESIKRKNYVVSVDENGKETTEWKSVRVVPDPEELKEAKRLRNKIHNRLHKIGAPGPGTLRVVAKDRENEVRAICENLKNMAREFNAAARYSTIDVFVGFFKVEGENVNALRETVYQMQDVLEGLETAMEARDISGVRDVLPEAKAFLDVLPDTVQEKMSAAIKQSKQQVDTISRAEKRASRLARKIAEELNRPIDSVDIDAELEALRAEATDKFARRRVRKIQRMVEDYNASLDQAEQMRQNIDTTPIRLMRYIVTAPSPVDEPNTGSSDLVAAQAAARQIDV